MLPDAWGGANVTAVFYCCHKAMKYMFHRKNGSIINTALANGIRLMCGTAYGMSSKF